METVIRAATTEIKDRNASPKASRPRSFSRKKCVKKNIGTIFKILKLSPDIIEGLQCAICPYKSTRKGNLKTHYKLIHLGGGGLSRKCSICAKKCSIKGNLKKHLIRCHNLTNEKAASLL